MDMSSIDPKLAAVISAAIALLIAILHMRGNDLPLLSPALRAIGGVPCPLCAPDVPAAPAAAVGAANPARLGPGRRLLLRLIAPEALREIATSRPFSAEDRAMLLRIADPNDLGEYLHRGVMDDVAAQPEALAALDAAPAPGQPHPLRYWLTHGGAQWIYQIAQIIAAILGHPLPNLPPLPPIPPLPAPAP